VSVISTILTARAAITAVVELLIVAENVADPGTDVVLLAIATPAEIADTPSVVIEVYALDNTKE
jgi:hypothetical protein